MKRMMQQIRRIGLCLFVMAVPALPQAGVGTLSGLVTDATHSAITNANVTVVSRGTALSRSTLTDNSGYYSFTSLPVGTYDITVEDAGFASARRSFLIDPSAKSRQDFELAVAGTAQSLTVTTEAPQLSRDDASIGTVIDNQTIISTPLFMRNWDDLIRLIPGVQAQRYTEQSGGTASGRTGSLNIHGIDSLQNNFIMDGIDNNTFSENVQELSTQAARPSVDVIGEFKLISNPYTAEYGRSPGAVVDVTTKGGTNEVHGLLFEYFRNRVFDSNDFFSNKSGLAKPENVQNQFGGNVGAPIIKNKLFGFFDYEGTRIRRGITRISTVPLPNERIGDFSPATAAGLGLKYATLLNPVTHQPFPNNQIPAGMIDKYGQQLMNLFPLPNQPGEFNNYARTGSLADDTDSYDARVDWNANEKNTVLFRYTGSSRIRDIPGYFGGIADGTSTSAWGNSTLRSYSAVIGFTHVFGPQIVNDFRAGYVRNFAYDQQQPFGLNPASQYVPGVPANPTVAGGVSQTTFDNFTFIGSPDYLPKQQVPQQFQYVDTVSWNLGAHSLKFGADVRAPMRNIYQDEASTRGTLEFSGQYTGGSNSYGDALLGYVRAGTLSNVYFVDQRLWMAAGFVQDDWKVTPKLTLNLGLRYEFASPAVEGKNHQANFEPAGSGSLVYASNGSLADRALVQINTHNLAPRFGLAYSANDKTVLRGGYGIYYMNLWRDGSENQIALNPPYLRQTTLTGTVGSPAFQLQSGFPSNLLDPNNINYSLTHIRAVAMDSPTPYVQQWSFGIQRTLPAQLVATVDYVGTKTTHLDIIHDLNQYVNGLKPYPGFGYLEYEQSTANGSYNGLEASVQRRFQNGLSLDLAYTWSKSIQTTYMQTFTRALSGFDIPQRVVASFLYEFPFGEGKPFLTHGVGAAVLGGWRTSGVYTFSSGLPFSVSSGSNYSNALDAYGAATALPNVTGTPQVLGNISCWFYVSSNKACQSVAPGGSNAFAPAALGQFGNAGVNILRGPHSTVFDFSLMRDFRMTERAGLQIACRGVQPDEHANVLASERESKFGQRGNDYFARRGSSGYAVRLETVLLTSVPFT